MQNRTSLFSYSSLSLSLYGTGICRVKKNEQETGSDGRISLEDV